MVLHKDFGSYSVEKTLLFSVATFAYTIESRLRKVFEKRKRTKLWKSSEKSAGPFPSA